MYELSLAIPDVEVLLALEPEELAAKMLFLLRVRSEAKFHPSNLVNELSHSPHDNRPSYPRERIADVSLAAREALAWLEMQGLIVPAPDTSGESGWRVLSRRARRFENEGAFADYTTARLLPKELLHPSIANETWLSFMRGAFATAVFQAMRAVEIAVREAAGFPQGYHGVPMIRRAFHKENGPLTDPGAEEAEKEALSALFAGAIGSYKNPHSHRDVPLDNPQDAVEIIVLASHLLRIVDARRTAKSIS